MTTPNSSPDSSSSPQGRPLPLRPQPSSPEAEASARAELLQLITEICEAPTSSTTPTPQPDGDPPIDLSRLPPDTWTEFLGSRLLVPADLQAQLAALPADPYNAPPKLRAAVTLLLDLIETTLEHRYGIAAPWYIARLNDYPPIQFRLLKEA